jgi:hypothetical protein
MNPSGASSRRSRGSALNRALCAIIKPGAGQTIGRNPNATGHVEFDKSPTGLYQDPSRQCMDLGATLVLNLDEDWPLICMVNELSSVFVSISMPATSISS